MPCHCEHYKPLYHYLKSGGGYDCNPTFLNVFSNFWISWFVCVVSLATLMHFSGYSCDFYLEVLPAVLNFCG